MSKTSPKKDRIEHACGRIKGITPHGTHHHNIGYSPKIPTTLRRKIRSDLNLEKWTLWTPAKSKTEPRVKTLRRVFDLPDGTTVTAEVEVGFTNRGGLTTEDQKTFYALLKLWEDKGRPTEQTYYSLRRLTKVLNKKWGTNVINATSESLARFGHPLNGRTPTKTVPRKRRSRYSNS